MSGLNDPQVFAWFKYFMNLRQVVPHSTPATPVGTLNRKRQEPSIKIMSPITSLTPLHTSFRNPSSKLTFVSDLAPIFLKEMPPSDFVFSKKQKVILKRESHQKDGVITKRQTLVYDGKYRYGSEFAKEVVGSLGGFSISNQWLVDNLTKQLWKKYLLVEQLKN